MLAKISRTVETSKIRQKLISPLISGTHFLNVDNIFILGLNDDENDMELFKKYTKMGIIEGYLSY